MAPASTKPSAIIRPMPRRAAGDQRRLAGDGEEVGCAHRPSLWPGGSRGGQCDGTAPRTSTLAPTRSDSSSTEKVGLWWMPLVPSEPAAADEEVAPGQVVAGIRSRRRSGPTAACGRPGRDRAVARPAASTTAVTGGVVDDGAACARAVRGRRATPWASPTASHRRIAGGRGPRRAASSVKVRSVPETAAVVGTTLTAVPARACRRCTRSRRPRG